MSFLRKIASRAKGGGSESGLTRSKTFPVENKNNDSSRRPPTLQQFLKEKQEFEENKDTIKNFERRKFTRLTQSLRECLNDPSSLGYFLQYLETKHLDHLVKFYLDVQSYRSAATESHKAQSDKNLDDDQKSERYLTPSPSTNPNNISCFSDGLDDNDNTNNNNDYQVENDNKSDHQEKSDSVNTCDILNVKFGDKSNEADDKKQLSSASDMSSLTSQKSSVTSEMSSLTDAQSLTPAKPSTICDTRPEQEVGETRDSFDSGIQKSDSDTNKDVGSVWVCDTDSIVSVQSLNESFSLQERIKDEEEEMLKAKTEDAVKIYRRYIAPESETPVPIPTVMKKDIVEEICAEFGVVSTKCFDNAQDEVVRQLDRDYYPHYLDSGFHKKHQIDVLTGGSVMMTDILYHDIAVFHFMEHMEAEGVRHVLEFFIAGKNFELSLNSGVSNCYNDVTHDAMILYDKYFSMQAKFPLGFGDDIRLEIENNICQESGPQINCFNRALNIIVEYMERKYLQKFLVSKLFDNFINELITSIQNGSSASTLDRCKSTESLYSCKSDQTNPTQRTVNTSDRTPNKNTLLANADNFGPRIENLEMDTTIQQDPDSIWRRDPVKGKVGEVDTFGRYHSAWEPPPDVNKDGGLLGKVKRLRGVDAETRLKEDMAWQVAQMFIQDVISVTMAKEEDES